MKKLVGQRFCAVILAGGNGERFWPLSTPRRPKQFLNYFGGESLIRQTVSRFDSIARPEDVFVLTTKSLRAATIKELGELPPSNIIGEPMRRDTLAALALGVGLAGKADDPVVGFFPSDNLVTQPVKFRKALRKAISLAQNKKCIVTLGIKPTYPSVAFGYINPATGKFIEKPDVERAKKYIKAGCLWNAGMFFARASVFRELFREYAPAVLPLSNAEVPKRRLLAFYSSLARISFDYAVMEKLPQKSSSKNKDAIELDVVPGDFGWDDVGGYAAFDEHFPHDDQGNVREGPCVVVDSQSNICVARDAKISLLGVKNLVVVATSDNVLVADKSRIADLKELFKQGAS